MPDDLPAIGELDRRIDLQHNTPGGTNDYNQPIESWATFASVWAKLEHHRSTEGEDAARQFAGFEGFFTIRYRGDVLAEDRIVYDGETFQVIGRPRELGRRQYLKLLVRGVE
jgi:SPP1 family predicted phage head-tail adaptor